MSDTDVEISELLEIQPTRVDAVGSPANGTDWLILKSTDQLKPRVGETMTEFRARVGAEKSVEDAQAEGAIAGKTPTPHAGSDGAAPSGATGSNAGADCDTCHGTGEVDGTPCSACDGAEFSEAEVKEADGGAASDGDSQHREKIDKAQGGCGCCKSCQSDCSGNCCDDCDMDSDDAEKSVDPDAACDDEDCQACKELLEKKKLSYGERKRLPKGSFVFPKERKYPIHDEAHARNALARVSQFGTPEEKAKVRAAVHRKYPNIDQASAAKSESEPVVKDGIVSGPNPFLATADDGDDKSDGGSADAPGSSAWEAVDAATAEEAAVALMSAAEKIREFASREAQEVAAGEGNDVFDTFAAEQALSATMSAVGVMAQMAFHEGLAAAKSEGNDVEKAGRRLSSKTVGALTALRDHVNNLLGDDDPAHPRTDEAVEDAAKSILSKEIETLTLDELMKALDERDEARRVAEEAAKAEAEEAAKGKSETEQVASVANAKRENKRKRNKASEKKDYDALEDEATQGTNSSASGTRDAEGGAKSVAEDGDEVEATDEVAEPAEKVELTEEEIEAKRAKKEAKKALKKARKDEEIAVENARLRKAIEEATAEAQRANAALEERLATVEKMAAPSTVVRTRPADAMQKASERDALDVEINRLEQLVKSTQDRDIREGSRARMVELRQQRDAL